MTAKPAAAQIDHSARPSPMISPLIAGPTTKAVTSAVTSMLVSRTDPCRASRGITATAAG